MWFEVGQLVYLYFNFSVDTIICIQFDVFYCIHNANIIMIVQSNTTLGCGCSIWLVPISLTTNNAMGCNHMHVSVIIITSMNTNTECIYVDVYTYKMHFSIAKYMYT